MKDAAPHRIIRLPAVEAKTGLTGSQIYRLMSKDQFPQSVTLGRNSRGWVEAEVDHWIQARIDARDRKTDTDLRVIHPGIGRGRPRKDAEQAVA